MSNEEKHHSHELLKYIIEHTRSAVAVHDRELNYLYVSQRYLDEYNVESQDVIGKHHYEVFPDLPQKWRDVHQRVLAGEVLSAEEDSYPKEDGSIVWTRWECRPWYEADGSVGGIIVYTEVITDRISEREKLRESEHRFRTLFDQAADNIFLLKPSPDGPPIIADVNPSGAKLHGYTPSELIGQHLTIIDPFVSPEEVASRTERLESGEIVQFEAQHLHKNGERLWLEVTSKLIVTGSERFYLSTERNITARKKAEEENERLTDRLLLSTRAAQLGVWDWNVRENTMVWDDRMFELYGVTREGTPNNIDAWLNGLHPEDKESALAVCQAALDGQKDFDTEFRVLHPDGTVKYLKANGLVIMGADGKPDRMLGVNSDITEMKKLQDAQLRSSQLSALGEVAAGVAHEINNPINGVINYAQMLINKNDENDNANQILEKIIREGSRIANIVRNLLNFARKDRGEFSSLDLIDIVAEPINLHSQFFKNDGIHIEVGVPGDLPRIYGNQMQLEQVLLNLLSNARYALNKKFPEPSNEKFIVIEAASVKTSAGECVQLSVKDTGCGIPKEHLDKIFNPFYTTKEAGVGTGLGMSVSHELLEKHGATIKVDSQVNKFTAVTITFPAKPQ